MAFDANETIWTPGRRHAAGEIEAEFNAGVASLDPAVGVGVRTSDFDPNAALPPWVFAQSRSRCAIHLKHSSIDLAPTVARVVDVQWLHTRLGFTVVRWTGYIYGAGVADWIVGADLLWRSRDAMADTVIASAVINSAVAISWDVAVANVEVVRGGALKMRIQQTAGVNARLAVMGTALGSRRWVASLV